MTGSSAAAAPEVDGSEHGDERQLLFFYSTRSRTRNAGIDPTFHSHRLGNVAGESRVSLSDFESPMRI